MHYTKEIMFEFAFAMAFSIGLALALFLFVSYLGSDAVLVFGDKSNIFYGIILGMPIGSVIGLVVADSRINNNGTNWLGIVLGLMLSSLFALWGSVKLLDWLRGSAVFLIPLPIVLLAQLGFKITKIIKRCEGQGAL